MSINRIFVPAIDAILGETIPVLDHGFIRIIDYMGSDDSVVQAARVSYGNGTKRLNQDKALINYLIANFHTTPFEMCEIKFHVKLPIFVARQWLRHRTANVNERSARYSIVGDEFFVPDPSSIGEQSEFNKQARDINDIVNNDVVKECVEKLNNHSILSYDVYNEMLAKGFPRELARIMLGVNVYTEMYWKIDLHNLFHFVKLRSGHGAQHEIKQYANVISGILEKWVPISFEAFKNYRVNGVSFSDEEIKMIRKLIKQEKVDIDESGIGKNRIMNFKKVLMID